MAHVAPGRLCARHLARRLRGRFAAEQLLGRRRLPLKRQLCRRTESLPPAAGRTAATGVTAGCLGSLVGLGGGFVAVPMMTSWVGISQHLATGSSLAVVLMTGASGAFGYMQHGQIDYEVALAIALGGMIFARAGAKLMASTDATRLKLYMGTLQVAVSPLIPLKSYVYKARHDAGDKKTSEAANETSEETTLVRYGTIDNLGDDESSFDLQRFLKMFAVGSVAGFLSGMFGVGGGALTVPAIALSTDLPQHAVVGTSLLAMLPPAVIGTAVNLSNGNISLAVAAPLAVGSFVGGSIGSICLAPVLPEAALQMLFSVLMASLGTRTILVARRALAAAAKASK
eukprot:scaffold387_cov244-Pinguiococcus_pyrenoidosus.AAC.1